MDDDELDAADEELWVADDDDDYDDYLEWAEYHRPVEALFDEPEDLDD